jgi:hypothetical protein
VNKHPQHQPKNHKPADTHASNNIQVCWRIITTVFLWCGTNKTNAVVDLVMKDVVDSII